MENRNGLVTDASVTRATGTAERDVGVEFARKVGLPTSPDTLLRLLQAVCDQAVSTPRVLGVDDVALRGGRGARRYATL